MDYDFTVLDYNRHSKTIENAVYAVAAFRLALIKYHDEVESLGCYLNHVDVLGQDYDTLHETLREMLNKSKKHVTDKIEELANA